MTQLMTDVEAFASYADHYRQYPTTTIIGALLLRLIDLQSGTSSAQTLSPSLTIATASGSIPAGAKFVSIAIKVGTGTVMGTPVDTSIESLELPYAPMGYAEIPYTVDAGGQFVILTGV